MSLNKMGLYSMVSPDAEFSTVCAAHDVCFDLFGAKVFVGLTGTHFDGRVDWERR